MKSWTLNILLIIGIVAMLFTIGKLLQTETPYDLDHEFIRPSQPWEQLIWYAKIEGP